MLRQENKTKQTSSSVGRELWEERISGEEKAVALSQASLITRYLRVDGNTPFTISVCVCVYARMRACMRSSESEFPSDPECTQKDKQRNK